MWLCRLLDYQCRSVVEREYFLTFVYRWRSFGIVSYIFVWFLLIFCSFMLAFFHVPSPTQTIKFYTFYSHF